MAYNEYLSDRVRHSLKENKAAFEEKIMFGGLCWFVDEKLCVGTFKEELLVRIAPENQENYLATEDCRLMDASMKGFLYVSAEAIDMDDDLDKWVKRCLEFNPRAKANKKKKL